MARSCLRSNTYTGRVGDIEPNSVAGVRCGTMREFLTVLGAWTFDPVLGVGMFAAAAAYFWAVAVINRRTPAMPWPRRYTVSFMSGLVIMWIVLLGPFGAYDDVFFWAHMVQHIALMMLVAPLLLLGAPVLLLLRVSSRQVRRRWLMPVLRSRLLQWLTRPVVGWVIFAGVLLGTHFSPFYEFSLNHPLVHRFVEHPLYLGAALIYYYPLLATNPGPRNVPYAVRAISLFTMMFPETMSGFFIYSSRYVMYPFFAHVSRPFGPGPIVDQQLGGALMWAGSMVIDSVWVAIAVCEWLRSEKRVAQRLDLQTMRELALAGAGPK
jgi:cytochrome c oxidase assembly factor CtaG